MARGGWCLAAALWLSACGARSGLDLRLDASSHPASGGSPAGAGAFWTAGGNAGLGEPSPGGSSAIGGAVAFGGAPSTRPVAIAVATGNFGSGAVFSDGSVRWWGQFADDPLGQSTLPLSLPGISGAKSLARDLDHSCALVQGGAIRCWGSNSSGQLGDGHQSSSLSTEPVTVVGITNAVSIAVADSFSCAVLADGAVQCWGYGGSGQLGDPLFGFVNSPTNVKLIPGAVSGITQAVAVTAGYVFACALLAPGGVMCWGANYDGQLGTGKISPASSINYPVPVYGLSDAVSVSAGTSGACALSRDGMVRCWGRNNQGQLGDGTHLDSARPVAVQGLTGAIAVAAGNASACAIVRGGTVQCWGYNGDGQLGDGTTTPSLTPVTVIGITNAVAVSVHAQACALLSTGVVQCWGYNQHGELGNGSTVNSLLPVTVSGL